MRVCVCVYACLYMELQLGLSLPVSHNNYIEVLDLNNKGLDPKERSGLELRRLNGGGDGDGDHHHVCLDNIKKRSFEEYACGSIEVTAPKTLPLLSWSSQPNGDDDDGEGGGGDQWEKKRISCMTINKKVEAEEEEAGDVVGWPPIKSWRKKLLYQAQQQQQEEEEEEVVNNRSVGRKERSSSKSMYVKVRMEGVGITRKIDICLFNSYHSLANSLINLFGQKLEKDIECYILTYKDRDGDWLLAGDVPWQNFKESVQRLEIVRNGRLN